MSTFACNTPVTAAIIGDLAIIHVPALWYKATSFSVIINNETVEEYNMHRLSIGFEYEIEEVMNCIDNNHTQCKLVPHSFSLLLSQLMEEVCDRLGGVFGLMKVVFSICF